MIVVEVGPDTWQWWKHRPYWRCMHCRSIIKVFDDDVRKNDVEPTQWDGQKNVCTIQLSMCPNCGSTGINATVIYWKDTK